MSRYISLYIFLSRYLQITRERERRESERQEREGHRERERERERRERWRGKAREQKRTNTMEHSPLHMRRSLSHLLWVQIHAEIPRLLCVDLLWSCPLTRLRT